MPTVSELSSEITEDRQTVEIKITTKGNWTSGDESAVCIKRIKDHPDWDLIALWGKKAVENRYMPTDFLTIKDVQDGTDKTYEWIPCWSWDGSGKASNDMTDGDYVSNDVEIYGVLRAEHMFKKWGWQKVNSKMGNHGIDSLFKKGKQLALCESKAGGVTGAVDDYIKFLEMHSDEEGQQGDWSLVRRKKDMVTSRLRGGGIRWELGRSFPNQYTETKIYEMTKSWVETKIDEMIQTGGRLRKTGQQLQNRMKKGKAFRYFNYYAADPLYALPGVYVVHRCRTAEFLGTDEKLSKKEKVFDWPDRGERLDQEFLWLDIHEPFLDLEENNKEEVEDEIEDVHSYLPDDW